jgi:hypothetical protein
METGAVTVAMDRASGRIFLFSYLLVYFAALECRRIAHRIISD